MSEDTTLALLGGKPVRTAAFSSNPMVDSEEIELVVHLMEAGIFSKFVGSPIPGTFDILSKKSRDLPIGDIGSNILGGEYVRKFESFWSEITGADYCISVNSATSGITTSLLALDLEPGSEVITTPFSFTATCAAIIAANCVPVFCDIDKDTFCISPHSLKSVITKKTKCVLAVHWCGNAGDLDEIGKICQDKNLYLVEDSAQAPATFYKGKALGTIGDVGILSFNEPKNIMTGEGGLILTNNERIAKKCRLIRNHGEAIVEPHDSDQSLVNIIGYNFRLTEIHAAIAYVQSKKYKKINSIRSRNYRYLVNILSEKFSDYVIPQKITHPDSFYAYTASFRWNYVFSSVHRDIVADALNAEGIPTFRGYHRLMCDHPMFKRKIAFGKGGHPWIGNNIDYNKIEIPNVRNLFEKEFLGFLLMGWPNTTVDMDDIVRAFEKIIINLDSLEDFTSKKSELNLGR